MSEIDYTIGDEIVCIDTSVNHKTTFGLNGIERDKIYTAIALARKLCCGSIIVDVGIVREAAVTICSNCGKECTTHSNYYKATRFRKLDTLINIDELTEVLETKQPFQH